MGKLGWKKKRSSDKLQKSLRKSGLFGRKRSNKEESSAKPSPEYETPPPSPDHNAESSKSPLHVTVVASKGKNSPEKGDGHSLGGSTISDLSGSYLAGIKQSSIKKVDSSESDAAEPATVMSPYSEAGTEGFFSQTTQATHTEEISNSCPTDIATDFVNGILGFVESGLDGGCKAPVRGDDVKSATPTAANEDVFSSPNWGTAPSMSADEDDEKTTETTDMDTSGPDSESREPYWKSALKKAAEGSACSTSCFEESQTRNTSISEKDDAPREKTEIPSSPSSDDRHHENFELVLEDDGSASTASASKRALSWLKSKSPKRPQKRAQKTPLRSNGKDSSDGKSDLSQTPKSQTDADWRRNATDANGKEIQPSEFVISRNMSLTSDMDQEEMYRAVFGADPEAGAQKKKPEEEKKSAKKEESTRSGESKKKEKKKGKGMFKAMSKRLSGVRSKTPDVSVVVEERPKENAAEIQPDEEKAVEAVDSDRNVEESDHGALSENDLIGEVLVDELDSEQESRRRLSSLLPVEDAGKGVHPDDEKATISEPPNLTSVRSRSLSSGAENDLRRQRSNTSKSKSTTKAEKDLEPKSLTRTLSNPLRALSNSFASRKSKSPPPMPPRPERPVWKAVHDKASGKTYYYHRLSRQTTWTKPEEFDAQMDAYERSKREYGKSAISLSNNLSAEDQKKLEDGVPLQPRKRSLTGVLRRRSKERPNTDEKTRDELSILMKQMGSTDLDNEDELLQRYEGNEQELLRRLRSLAAKRPFDEPLEEKKMEEEPRHGVLLDKSNIRTRTLATTSTGTSGISSRARSTRTALSSTTDTTQKVKNTSGRYGSPYSSVAPLEIVDEGDLPLLLAPPERERELRVEEFESGRYDVKRAEVFDTKPVSPHSSQRKLVKEAPPVREPPLVEEERTEADETSTFLDYDEDETDLDTYGTDSVSELGHSDAEFQRQKRRYDVARRMALEDAIRNGDWELAASVTENIRGRSFDSKTSLISAQEWTQGEVDQLISENDWDAVAAYIEYMRDKDEGIDTGYAIPHMQEKSKPKKKKSEIYDDQPPQIPESTTKSREMEEEQHGPQKRFGARSQLQHPDDKELVSIASSWDSVYRTDSSDDSFLTTSEESSYYQARHSRSRRMAT